MLATPNQVERLVGIARRYGHIVSHRDCSNVLKTQATSVISIYYSLYDFPYTDTQKELAELKIKEFFIHLKAESLKEKCQVCGTAIDISNTAYNPTFDQKICNKCYKED